MTDRTIQRGPRTIEVYADTKGRQMCNGPTCKVRLTWAEIVKSGKKMCFSGDPVPLETRHEDGTHRLIEALLFDENHWATCIDRQKFRTRR